MVSMVEQRTERQQKTNLKKQQEINKIKQPSKNGTVLSNLCYKINTIYVCVPFTHIIDNQQCYMRSIVKYI